MITKIVLRNFKRFKEETFELDSSEMEPHVIFAGRNDLGKTTVIQAVLVWHFALKKWCESNNKKRSIRLSRSEFFSVPLREFNQLWTEKSTGMKKGEEEGVFQGTPRPIEIEIHGKNEGKEWHLNIEFKYSNNDFIYAKPKNAENIPDAAINLEAAYIPSLAGIMTDEPECNRALQDVLIGQGKSGDILRNLLLEVSEKKDDWKELCRHIKDIFNYELAKPSGRGQSYISCEYRSVNLQGKLGPLFDINTAGSGFQQLLLIIAFLYARPSSVILLDEPDAHLHINLQSEMYSILKKIAKKRGGQLMIATHSKVLIDSTSPKKIISFFGKHTHKLS